MSSQKVTAEVPQQQLSLFDSVSIIVGIIIGVGIFEATPLVASSVSGPWMLMAVWAVGGVLAMVGALCFAELATTYPKQGGDYVYLTKAFGSPVGFLFVWAQFWIIRPGNIGAMSYVFAKYAGELIPLKLGGFGFMAYACSAVVLLTAINVLGVRSGKWTQNLLSSAKVGGLLLVFAAAFLWFIPPPTPETTKESTTNLPFALIMVMFAYGGWNDISFVAAEVRNPQRNMLRALLVGTIMVIGIYLMLNLAFLYGLGLEGIASSKAVATDLIGPRFGDWGSRGISLLICISSLGAINGMTLTGARIFYALGTENSVFRWLGKWDGSMGAPLRALVGQGAVTLALVVGFGSYENGFERMVIFATPLFWSFLALVAVALFVLRRKDPNIPGRYKVLFFPVTPCLFYLTCLVIIYFSANHAATQGHLEGLWAILIMLVGLLLAIAFGLQLIPNNSGKPKS